jgi:hypothetical protein
MDNKNHKKLLCNNIVNGIKCLYRHKCMFAHELSEQKVDNDRLLAIKIVSKVNDLSYVDIYNNKQLFDEMIILTKECKNCINNKCTGGYNCKYGTCLKELKICYDDLMCGKCINFVDLETKCCLNGIHLTEKKLIPYSQRQNIEENIKKPTLLSSGNINYNSKINAISMQLTDETLSIANDILKGNINDKDIIKHSRIIHDEFINDDKMSKIEYLINENRKKNKIIAMYGNNNDSDNDDDYFMNEIKNI